MSDSFTLGGMANIYSGGGLPLAQPLPGMSLPGGLGAGGGLFAPGSLDKALAIFGPTLANKFLGGGDNGMAMLQALAGKGLGGMPLPAGPTGRPAADPTSTTGNAAMAGIANAKRLMATPRPLGVPYPMALGGGAPPLLPLMNGLNPGYGSGLM
jgi:hypothetical protein